MYMPHSLYALVLYKASGYSRCHNSQIHLFPQEEIDVDFTDDRSAVKWAAFLEDERYAGEGLNVYEGAFSYARGVWRSTSTSLMKSNSGAFNVPSREAIWCRIHRLAYGSSWKYDREDFVEYDAVNRVTAGR